MNKSHPTKILIVKTSSLGDIIQTFPILSYLHRRFPNGSIDWAVEESLASVPAAHPLVRRTFSFDIKGLKKKWFSPDAWSKLFHAFRNLRKETYHYIFDLQGNCKSGVITFCSRGGIKVGLGLRSVREWPNVLATQVRIEISKEMNIRYQHLHLMQQFFKDEELVQIEGVRFKITSSEQQHLDAILNRIELKAPYKIMICPGSKWRNKQIPLDTLALLMRRIQEKLEASFLLVWGDEAEKDYCLGIQKQFLNNSLLIDRLSLACWQNLMSEVNLVLAVDSSALHLCGTTSTPSFSIFGPSSSQVFKPIGQRHCAIQGTCPYHRTFAKTCPILRSCPTGACIRELTAEEIYSVFIRWFEAEIRVS